MKKNISFVGILTILLFSFILNVKADVSVYTASGTASASSGCGQPTCANVVNGYYGIKITFMKKNSDSKLVAINNISGINLSSNHFYLINDSFKNISAIDNAQFIKSNTIYKSFNFNGNLSEAALSFPTYLSKANLTNNNNSELKRILSTINSNLIVNNDFNSKLENIYLEVEPVVLFRVRDYYNNNKGPYSGGGNSVKFYYFYGTPTEISKDVYSINTGKFKSPGGQPLRSLIMAYAITDGNGRSCHIYKSGELIDVSTYKYRNFGGPNLPGTNTVVCSNISEWPYLKNYYTAMSINNTSIKPFTKNVGSNINQHSAYAFAQINDKSIHGKTLINLSDFVATCASDFDAIQDKKDIQKRYELYLKYGSKYNNLFNLNAKTGSSACQIKSCPSNTNDSNSKKSCLNYKSKSEEEDYSCYSDLVLDDTKKKINYICNTDFEFKNNLKNSSNLEITKFNVWPGLRLTGTGGVIGKVTVQKSCYIPSGRPRLWLSYSNNEINKYVQSIQFNDTELETKLTSIRRQSDCLNEQTRIFNNGKVVDEYVTQGSNGLCYNSKGEIDNHKVMEGQNVTGTKESYYKNNHYYKYIKVKGATPSTIKASDYNKMSIQTDYGHEYVFFDYDVYAPEQNLKKGTGAIEEELSNNESYDTDRGIFTSYNWAIKKNGYIPFKITFKEEGKKAYLEDYSSDVDKNISNKCSYSVSKNGLFKECTGKCDNSTIKDLALEFRQIDTKNPFINKEGEVRNTMTNWCSEDDCTSNNELVTKVIKNSTNSYGISGENKKEPKYKITLTPEVIADIKVQSDNNHLKLSYDKFNLNCNSEKICTSKLLTYLKDTKGVLTINNSTKRN